MYNLVKGAPALRIGSCLVVYQDSNVFALHDMPLKCYHRMAAHDTLLIDKSHRTLGDDDLLRQRRAEGYTERDWH